MQDNKSQPLILAHSVIWVFVMAGCLSSVRPQFAKIANGTSINTNQEWSQKYSPRNSGIWHYIYLNSNPPKPGARVNLSYSRIEKFNPKHLQLQRWATVLFSCFFILIYSREVLGICINPLHIPKMRCIVGLTKKWVEIALKTSQKWKHHSESTIQGLVLTIGILVNR